MYAKTILVGIDGSPNSTRALQWAIEYAAAVSAEVTAMHAFFIPVLAYSASGYVPPEQIDAERQAQHIFDAALENIDRGAQAVKVALQVVEGYPPDVLAKAAEEPNVATVVIGARGHGKIEELFLGSVGHALTHRCHKPLVIIPPRSETGDGRVVVGFKGTPESMEALRWAIDHARRCPSRLEVLTVCPAAGSDLASSVLSDALTQIGTDGIAITAETVEGRPAEVLLDRARGADLLVVGTRGLGTLHEVLTGSVTHACAEHSPVPVAIVRNYPPTDD